MMARTSIFEDVAGASPTFLVRCFDRCAHQVLGAIHLARVADVLSLRAARVFRRLLVRSPYEGSSLELSKTPRWIPLLYDLLCGDPTSAPSICIRCTCRIATKKIA